MTDQDLQWLTVRIKNKMHGIRLPVKHTTKSSKRIANSQKISYLDRGAVPTDIASGIHTPKAKKMIRFAEPTATGSDQNQTGKGPTHADEIENICTEMVRWDPMIALSPR